MKQPTLNDIYLAVGELNGEVKGINRRLDKMNGTISSHDDRINKNESAIDQQRGRAAIIGGVVGGIVSIIGLVLAWFGLKK